MLVITTRVLTDLGYRVLTASTVTDGFNLWQERQAEIKLIITDYIFDGTITGMDLLIKVHVRVPELPVLIVSGSWLPDAKQEPPLPANVTYLAKPFTRAEIAHIVCELLSAPPPKFHPWSPRCKPSE